ncbi:very-long-chain 3-oxoacyl-CoA reductase-like [Adelges cooleyi]|uniref:very-long-chain 3-oxoacyl-CoA reductase-like n=1 Tax=Adelges cooleyi TaxID=133065 RepID=UPI00218038F2|nr:very-long-chain 3-oxoacyl-CoA reductase-like [Adelges cooleyi]
MACCFSSMNTVEIIGFVFICVICLKLTRFVLKFSYQELLAPFLHFNVDFKKTGKWAVITGSTDGIGKQYAEQLAGKGMDVVLISRTRSKLESTADVIRNKYGVNAKIIEVDFTDNNPDAMYDRVAKELRDLDVGTLINNVGLCNPYPDYFLNFDQNDPLYDNIIKCNIVSVVNMCRIVMPGMVHRRRGVIVNVSSASAELPSPLLTVYGATKAFVNKFSIDLATEYNRHGIIVQCVTPGFVATNMSKIRKASLVIPSAETFVQSALQTTGIKNVTAGYFPHSVFMKCIQLAEGICRPFLAKIEIKVLLAARERLKKQMVRKEQKNLKE